MHNLTPIQAKWQESGSNGMIQVTLTAWIDSTRCLLLSIYAAIPDKLPAKSSPHQQVNLTADRNEQQQTLSQVSTLS